MSWTLSTLAEAVAKAGVGANATVVVTAATTSAWADQAEAKLQAITRIDWVTDLASVPVNVKQILSKIIAAWVAIDIVAYDMSGYSKILEATTLMDYLKTDADQMLEILRNDSYTEKMGVEKI